MHETNLHPEIGNEQVSRIHPKKWLKDATSLFLVLVGCWHTQIIS